MRSRAGVLAMTLLASSTFFSYGCTFQQRKELLDEVKAYAIENGKELGKNLLTSAASAASEYVDKKLAEKEAFHLKMLDTQLAAHPVVEKDPETEVETTRTKTWKDFDADKSGHLEEAELVKAGTFIYTQIGKKVVTGEMSKDEGARQAKGTGITIGAIGLLMLAMRAAKKLKSKGSAPPGVPAPPSGGTT